MAKEYTEKQREKLQRKFEKMLLEISNTSLIIAYHNFREANNYIIEKNNKNENRRIITT